MLKKTLSPPMLNLNLQQPINDVSFRDSHPMFLSQKEKPNQLPSPQSVTFHSPNQLTVSNSTNHQLQLQKVDDSSPLSLENMLAMQQQPAVKPQQHVRSADPSGSLNQKKIPNFSFIGAQKYLNLQRENVTEEEIAEPSPSDLIDLQLMLEQIIQNAQLELIGEQSIHIQSVSKQPVSAAIPEQDIEKATQQLDASSSIVEKILEIVEEKTVPEPVLLKRSLESLRNESFSTSEQANEGHQQLSSADYPFLIDLKHLFQNSDRLSESESLSNCDPQKQENASTDGGESKSNCETAVIDEDLQLTSQDAPAAKQTPVSTSDESVTVIDPRRDNHLTDNSPLVPPGPNEAQEKQDFSKGKESVDVIDAKMTKNFPLERVDPAAISSREGPSMMNQPSTHLVNEQTIAEVPPEEETEAIQEADQSTIIQENPEERVIKLFGNWTFWYCTRGAKTTVNNFSKYCQKFVPLVDMHTVEDVVCYWYSIKSPRDLPPDVKIMFFKKDITPDWESNPHGASMSLKFDHSYDGFAEIEEIWETLVYWCAGEVFSDQVIGVVLNRQAQFENILEIWMPSPSHKVDVFQFLCKLLKKDKDITLTDFYLSVSDGKSINEVYTAKSRK